MRHPRVGRLLLSAEDILARLAELERRAEQRADILHRKVDGFGRALLFLAEHIIQQGNRSMSATTDAIKAKLTSLEADVDKAAEHAADTAKDALAAEEADLLDIEQRLDALGAKVHAMVPTVAAAVTPAAASPSAPEPAADVEHPAEAGA